MKHQKYIPVEDITQYKLSSLIDISSVIIKKYSREDSEIFQKYCENSDYQKAADILKKVLRKMNISESEFRVKAKNILHAFQQAASDNTRRPKKDNSKISRNGGDNMETVSTTVNKISTAADSVSTVIIIILAILLLSVLGAAAYCKVKGISLKQLFSSSKSKNKYSKRESQIKVNNYTESDLDMILLIEELNKVYKKTEEYMDS